MAEEMDLDAMLDAPFQTKVCRLLFIISAVDERLNHSFLECPFQLSRSRLRNSTTATFPLNMVRLNVNPRGLLRERKVTGTMTEALLVLRIGTVIAHARGLGVRVQERGTLPKAAEIVPEIVAVALEITIDLQGLENWTKDSEVQHHSESVGEEVAVQEEYAAGVQGVFKVLSYLQRILDCTRRHRVGYVEFYEEESVQKALAIAGQKLLGIPVMVQLTEAEKNRLALQAEQTVAVAKPVDMSYHRLYVGSIHFNLTEDDLKQIFEPFGPLEFVNLHKDPETGRSRGFAFIQYKNGEDAKQALEKMNGFELAGRNIKVGLVTDKNSGMNFSLDDGDMTGMSMNSQSRVELMNKLAARESDLPTVSSGEITPVLPPRPVMPVAMPSKTILLNNMFNPAE
ncbi:hypothetical protein BC936DRAFT_138531 [Jimgerdemannia flammicorona]|uniref:RRM domain-containing protein n=1 Tax=Jimgerdemannia flammicorona TaxID=994334 RepID=A0A433C735_9FUNG|nr:hypothetical protein BC936DRAFT_138531 [Jimgerdemannia flammicorona]